MKTKKSGPRPKKYSREWDWKYANRGWRYKRDAPYDKEWQEDRRKLFKEAGLPDGVINFIPGRGSVVGPLVMDHPNLAGVHFTGSTSVFQNMWEHIGGNIKQYASYPRIVGETGGKEFCIAHESVNKEAFVTAMVRGAYEFQGQKCSAMSRAYIPSSIWSVI